MPTGQRLGYRADGGGFQYGCRIEAADGVLCGLLGVLRAKRRPVPR
jgi:hypothetical protein